MNYEIKGVSPLLVFLNALRIFVVIGFLVGLVSFVILPNSAQASVMNWWQRLLATFLFTAVYTLVVSAILSLIAFLYNNWTKRFKGLVIHLEQEAGE